MRHRDNLDGNLGLSLRGMDPLWGALIASGVGTAGAWGARVLSSPGSKSYSWSDGIGLLVGGLAAGAMYMGRGTREAGKFGFLFVLVNQGLRLLEKLTTGGGLGWVVTQQEQMFGMPSMQQMNGGFGYTMAVDQPPRLAGAVAGPMNDTGHPPVLMGGNMGGAGMASFYGASLFGG